MKGLNVPSIIFISKDVSHRFKKGNVKMAGIPCRMHQLITIS